MWPVPHYGIFPHYLIKERFSEKKLLNKTKCVLIFSTVFVCTIFYSKRTERDIIKNVYRSSCKVAVILGRFSCNLTERDIIKNVYRSSYKVAVILGRF